MRWILRRVTRSGRHRTRAVTMFRAAAPPSRLPLPRSQESCFPAESTAVFAPTLQKMVAFWDVDTKTEYRTVNGVAARGGSIDGPGAVVVGGTLYVSSG